MSPKKHHPKAVVSSSPKGSSAPVSQSTARLSRLPLLPVPLIFFLLAWFFAGIWYGDVFCAANQYSFFAPDMTLMRPVWEQPYGSLWIAGRALLTLFHYPLLGGAVLALMLTLISWLTGYNLRLTARWRPLQYLPAGVYLGCLAYYGFHVYYQAETGMLMGIPLCALVVLAIQGAIIRSFSKKPVPALVGRPKDESRRQNLTGLLVAVLVVTAPMLYAARMRPYVRLTARMQNMMDRQDWEGIIRTAQDNAELSCRPMAALYAIALTQTEQITEHLFDIRFEYEDLHLHNRAGKESNGADFYNIDGNYYAGLLLAANRYAVEYITMQGPVCHALKRLTQIALLNGEREVAFKYLHILDKMPFEGEFVRKYLQLAQRPQALEQDAETARIRRVEPVSDAFHTNFHEPLFLGYNIATIEGRSINALHNSIAACLYTKLVPEAMMRCQPLAGMTLPRNINDATAIYARENPEIMKYFSGNEMVVPRYQTFLQAIRPYAKTRLEHAAELFRTYKGYYPYYYYFGNLKAPTRKKAESSSTEHKGVN